MHEDNNTTNKAPTISVIVPVYNAESTIIRCLKSIKAQTFTDFEAIIVDDGSPDNAIKLAQEYIKDDHRFLILSQANQGLGAARNTGIRAAHGEYMAFIDSDDSIQPFMFEKMIKCAKRTGADTVCCEVDNYLSSDGKIVRSLGHYLFPKCNDLLTGIEVLELQLNYVEPILFNSVCFKLTRRSLFTDNNIYFPEQFRYSEDTPTSVKLFLKTNSVALIRRPLYNYIHEGETLTSSYSLKNATDLLLDIEEIEDAIQSFAPQLDLSNFVIGLLFPLEKQIALCKAKDEKLSRKILKKSKLLRKEYRPHYTTPEGIPIVQKAKIFVAYHNLSIPVCKILSHLQFIPFVKHML